MKPPLPPRVGAIWPGRSWLARYQHRMQFRTFMARHYYGLAARAAAMKNLGRSDG